MADAIAGPKDITTIFKRLKSQPDNKVKIQLCGYFILLFSSFSLESKSFFSFSDVL